MFMFTTTYHILRLKLYRDYRNMSSGKIISSCYNLVDVVRRSYAAISMCVITIPKLSQNISDKVWVYLKSEYLSICDEFGNSFHSYIAGSRMWGRPHESGTVWTIDSFLIEAIRHECVIRFPFYKQAAVYLGGVYFGVTEMQSWRSIELCRPRRVDCKNTASTIK